MAPKRGWCKYCLDDYRQGDIIVRCSSCPRTFHRECLDHEFLTNSTATGYYQNNHDNPIDLSDFTCDSCQQYAQEIEIVNDERCKICKERNRDESDILLLCDGCPNSYHMSCLDLHVEPDSEKWYCPMCKPESFEGVNIRAHRRNPLLDTSEHVNSSICYVCQRHGKLLGCDFCSNSFHYDCLPEFDIDTIADVWECPCCRGEDPFINQMHKRWTISQIEKNSKTRRKSILTWKGVITRYRNRFILAHREELAPFVTTKIIDQLIRTFISNKNKNKKEKIKDVESQLDQLQEEQLIESNKFVIKARKSCYYPSGRRRDSRPMRNGVALKPHQEDGVDWLLKSFLTGGAILADEMGLGKTIQTLCFLSYLKMMNIEGPHLIVVPLSTVGNWLREIHRFTPHLTVVKICGSKTERLHAMSDRLAYNGLYDLFVTTYETVKCEEAFFVETVPRWQCLILDEAHRIKNQSGALRHSMDRIVSNMRLLLTELFRDSQIMEQAFNVKKRVRNEDEMNFTVQELESIKTLLSKIMLRRLKEQAISLPKKIFHDVWLPLSEETLKWYRTLMNIRTLMRENLSIKKLLGIVIKMRIICGHPRGIVSRPQQREKLLEFFKQDMEVQKQIESEANELNDLKGFTHIQASAKLTFLDKLLNQLHYENCIMIPNYLKMYNQHLKSLDQTLYRQFINTNPESLITSTDNQFLQPLKNPADMTSLLKIECEKLEQNKLGEPVNKFLSVQNGPVKIDFSDLNQFNLKAQLNFKPQNNLKLNLIESLKTESESSSFKRELENEDQSENSLKDGKVDKVSKKKKKKISKDLFLSTVENQYVRVPQNTSENKLYLSDCLHEVNLTQNCPYVSMRIYEKALEQEAKYKKSKEKRLYKFESTNLIEAAEDSTESLSNYINDPNRKTTRVIESDDENGDLFSSDDSTLVNGDKSGLNVEKNARGAPEDIKVYMHKVLIFTQFQLVLDELETYCINRGWKYMRLDGSTNKLIRELDIREFNSSNSNYFVYLISTRAGGLGINLTAANHVVLYDEDWNPFIDLQAIDRAHRIGQKRNVHIWKLISEWTVEERMALIREKKLQLDKLILHNKTTKPEADGCDNDFTKNNVTNGESGKILDEEDVIISLSHAAMLKMMMHGNKALKCLEAEQITDLKLNEIIDRKRRAPPEHLDDTNDIDDVIIGSSNQVQGEDRVIIQLVKEEDEIDITQEDPSSQPKKKLTGLLVNDLINEEDTADGYGSGVGAVTEGYGGEVNGVTDDDGGEGTNGDTEVSVENQDNATASSEYGAAGDNEANVESSETSQPQEEPSLKKSGRKRKMVMELEQAGLLWRSVREKKKPSMIYTPMEWQKKGEGRVLKHETKCFCCSKPKNFKTTYKDKEGNDVEVDYGELIKCFRCPKSYHKFCERVSNIKKTWSCRWHECCLCFRKSSQCGNLLIHCSSCPTSFCYDCFPPDYTRHYVSEEYYYNLNQRGLVANSTNWIFFLCSKCKIESERKRRSISGEERDKHKKEQKELRSELLSTIKSKTDTLNSRENRRLQSIINREDKKRIEAMKMQESELEERHRQLYQSLFPINLIAEIKNRINSDILNDSTPDKSNSDKFDNSYKPDNAERVPGSDRAAGSKMDADEVENVEKRDKSDRYDEDWGVGMRSKKRGLNFSNVRLPSRLLQFCDNCRIPLHNIYKYPEPCPFPKEYVKLDLEINVKKPKSEETPNHTLDTNTTATTTTTTNTTSSNSTAPNSTNATPMATNNESTESSDKQKKIIKKCYCSLCYEKNGKRSVHFRRHCDLLTPEDKEEYKVRHERVEKAMELLNKLIPTTANSIDYTQFNNIKLKSLYNHMLDQCDSLYLKALINVGLLPSDTDGPTALRHTPNPIPNPLDSTNTTNKSTDGPAVNDVSELTKNYIRSFNNIYKVQNNLVLPTLYKNNTDNT
uniref:SWI/SNF-related chromatin remodelling factor (ISWI homologue), putative n=1 Tax=Theileria annulata TaxID=5874 RepID=A0A3B0MXZ0_THEAN